MRYQEGTYLNPLLSLDRLGNFLIDLEQGKISWEQYVDFQESLYRTWVDEINPERELASAEEQKLIDKRYEEIDSASLDTVSTLSVIKAIMMIAEDRWQ